MRVGLKPSYSFGNNSIAIESNTRGVRVSIDDTTARAKPP
jgi:hypothetical protein